MASIKTLTVRYLRDLARKHLGKGHSKLKTREELLSALKKIVPGMVGEDGKTRPRRPAAQAGAARPVEVVRFEKPVPGAAAVPQPPRVVAEPVAQPLPERARANGARPNGARPPRAFAPAEPLVEGFFVARVAGEGEARRHHLTEDQVAPPVHTRSALHFDERLGELPRSYEDDRVVLLARDPHTLFLYWDFRPATRAAAFSGLNEPRALLRVYESGREVRTFDLALEARTWYVPGLAPGKTYRAELHALGRDGSWRRIGPASNEVTLPSDDLSEDTSVRFMRVPWDVPLNRLREALQAGRASVETPTPAPEPLSFTHHKWVPLPNSGSWQLLSWTQTLPRENRGGEGGAQSPGWLPGAALGSSVAGSWQLGGASPAGSWLLGSSWQSGASWQSGPTWQPPQPAPQQAWAPPPEAGAPPPEAPPRRSRADDIPGFPPHPRRRGGA